MTLLKEYINQNLWRDWISYIDQLPILNNEVILDLGCGTGYVTKLLSNKASKIIGIDANRELLEEAVTNNSCKNIQYLNHDLREINALELPLADGIWASFVAAYFPNFSSVFKNWVELLKPGGWIAIVEINDLFGHYPMNYIRHESFKEFYSQQCDKNLYDYEMGSKIKSYMLQENLSIVHDQTKSDKELSFNGPADPEILQAWDNRLNRLIALQEFFGEESYSNFKIEFSNCLKNQNHFCKAQVNYLIAKKQLHRPTVL